MFTAHRYTSAQRIAWDSYVKQSKNGTFLFLRGYMDYHCDRFADFSTLLTDEGGATVALFPANRVGSQLISHGGLSYGGMICDSSMTTTKALDVFSTWIAYCKQDGILEIKYKAIPSIYHRGPSDEDRYALFIHGASLYRRDVLSVLDLRQVPTLQQRRRRAIKKAIDSGIEVHESDDFPVFWTVLEQNLMSRHQTKPIHTVSEIKRLRDQFPENIQLFCAFESGNMCAGALLYYAAPTIHAQYVASTEAGRAAGALDLLFATLIEKFRSEAYFFDFGSSNEEEGRFLNRGLADFKEGFGARAICHDFYRLLV